MPRSTVTTAAHVGLTGLLVSLALSTTACGHRATPGECDELFAKNAEIELRESQHVTDPAVLAQRIAAVRAAEGEAFGKRCIGNRITDRTLTCVRQASSSTQLDKCL